MRICRPVHVDHEPRIGELRADGGRQAEPHRSMLPDVSQSRGS